MRSEQRDGQRGPRSSSNRNSYLEANSHSPYVQPGAGYGGYAAMPAVAAYSSTTGQPMMVRYGSQEAYAVPHGHMTGQLVPMMASGLPAHSSVGAGPMPVSRGGPNTGMQTHPSAAGGHPQQLVTIHHHHHSNDPYMYARQAPSVMPGQVVPMGVMGTVPMSPYMNQTAVMPQYAPVRMPGPGPSGHMSGQAGGPHVMVHGPVGRVAQPLPHKPDRAAQQQQHANKRRLQRGLEDHVKRTVYVSYVDVTVTEEQLAVFFGSCGPVMDCRICGDPNSNMRFAFLEFADEDAARAALAKTGQVLGGCPLRVQPSKTAIVPVSKDLMPRSEDEVVRCSRTVYVTSIDKRIERSEVRAFFEQLCGPVTKLRLLGDASHNTRIAFVEFASAEGATAALNCSGALLGALPVRVSPSKTPIRSDVRSNRSNNNHGSSSRFDRMGSQAEDGGDDQNRQEEYDEVEFRNQVAANEGTGNAYFMPVLPETLTNTFENGPTQPAHTSTGTNTVLVDTSQVPVAAPVTVITGGAGLADAVPSAVTATASISITQAPMIDTGRREQGVQTSAPNSSESEGEAEDAAVRAINALDIKSDS